MSLYPRAAESALANMPRSKGSKVFVVDYVNGSDSNPGTKWDAPLKTVEAAYAKCTTLKNDTVLLVGNGTSNLAAAAITWAKDYTHLIGLCARRAGAAQPRQVARPRWRPRRSSRSPLTAASSRTSRSGTRPAMRRAWSTCLVTRRAQPVRGLPVRRRHRHEQRHGRALAEAEHGGRFRQRVQALLDWQRHASRRWPATTRLEFAGGAMHTVFDDCVFALHCRRNDRRVHVACHGGG